MYHLSSLRTRSIPVPSTTSLSCPNPSSTLLHSIQPKSILSLTNGREATEIYNDFTHWLLDNGARFPHLKIDQLSRNNTKKDKADKENQIFVDENMAIEVKGDKMEKKMTMSIKEHEGANSIRGVMTQERSFQTGEELIFIPRKLMIFDDMGRATKLGQKVHRAWLSKEISLSSEKVTQIVLYILQSLRDPTHFFRPYYSVLPPSFSTLPVFWTADELNLLKGSKMVEEIQQRKERLRLDFDNIVSIEPEFANLTTFEEFLWARSAVGSRNFGVYMDNQKKSALVPFADLLNHNKPKQTSWMYDEGRIGFSVKAIHSINSYNEVTDSYGNKCNSRYLLYYGFAVPNNRDADGRCCNKVYFELGSEDNGKVTDDFKDVNPKQRKLTKGAITHHKEHSFITIKGSTDSSKIWSGKLSMNIDDHTTLLAFEYQRRISRAAFYRSKLDIEIGYGDRPNRIYECELHALNEIAKACQKRLSQYHQLPSPEDFKKVSKKIHRNRVSMSSSPDSPRFGLSPKDISPFTISQMECLAPKEDSINHKHAINLVHGEKEILNFWITTRDVARKVFRALSIHSGNGGTSGRRTIRTILDEEGEGNIPKEWRKDMERYFEAHLTRWW